MKPAAFTYHRAHDVTDAVGLLTDLAAAGEDPKLIAGGQSLMPMMNFRLARPSALIDLGPLRRLPSMTALDAEAGTLTLGALVTHHAVETATLPDGFAVLARAMRWVGHLPIRSRGTVAGSLVHGDATAEWCLLALAARRGGRHRGPGGATPRSPPTSSSTASTRRRSSPTRSSSRCGSPGPPRTPRSASSPAGTGTSRSSTRRSRWTSAESRRAGSGGRVVLGGVAPAPVRVPEAEAVLAAGGAPGPELFAAVADAAAAAIDPPDDPQVTAAYRRRLTRTLVADACAQAAGGPR